MSSNFSNSNVPARLTVAARIAAPIETVWRRYAAPAEIERWNAADPSWHCPAAEIDLRPDGRFGFEMAARDGSASFVFSGKYERVEPLSRIDYVMDDGRRATVSFKKDGQQTDVEIAFEPENQNSHELQTNGWQAILNRFKRIAERAEGLRTLRFSQKINAAPAVVFEKLIGPASYSQWAAAFNPTSRFEGSWEKGAEMRFLGTSEDGAVGGMISRIDERVEDRWIEIEHLGMIENGSPVLSGPMVEPWRGALESYSIRGAADGSGGSEISVAIDSQPEFEPYFEETFPQALALLKGLCER